MLAVARPDQPNESLTLVLTTLYPSFDLANVAMLYMLTVLLVGVQWGRGPAVLAAILNVVAFDFFFVPPRFSLIPADPQYYLTFTVMLAVGAIIGQIAGIILFQVRVASHREKRARTLYAYGERQAVSGHPWHKAPPGLGVADGDRAN